MILPDGVGGPRRKDLEAEVLFPLRSLDAEAEGFESCGSLSGRSKDIPACCTVRECGYWQRFEPFLFEPHSPDSKHTTPCRVGEGVELEQRCLACLNRRLFFGSLLCFWEPK